MRIIYLHQYFNTPRMSGGTRSWEMGRRLVEDGHDVHIVTADRDPAPGVTDWYVTDEVGMTVHWLPVTYSNRMSFQRRMRAFARFALGSRKRARDLGGDVVFASSTPLTIAIPAVYASRKNGIPMVFEVRDLWPELPIAVGALKNPISKWAARRLERLAYRNAARVVALSPGMKEGVAATGYPPDRITVIPNASDLELFQGRTERGGLLRERHDWLGDRPLVVYTGTFGLINGVDYLARVAAAAWDMDQEVRFAVIGGGAEKERVRETASTLGVLGHNFFMFGRVSKIEIADWLEAADVATSLFIDLPAMWVNSANKFFDALAAGRPIAVNYGGWQKRVIESEGCGMVLPAGNPEGAARRIVKHIRDPGWLDRAGRRALEVARSRYARDDLYREFEQVLTFAAQEGGG